MRNARKTAELNAAAAKQARQIVDGEIYISGEAVIIAQRFLRDEFNAEGFFRKIQVAYNKAA